MPPDPTDTAMCENEHNEPRWAVALLHPSDSTSAANVTALCDACLFNWFEDWLDEQTVAQADAYELRPLAPGGCPNHTSAAGPHHDTTCGLYDMDAAAPESTV